MGKQPAWVSWTTERDFSELQSEQEDNGDRLEGAGGGMLSEVKRPYHALIFVRVEQTCERAEGQPWTRCVGPHLSRVS